MNLIPFRLFGYRDSHWTNDFQQVTDIFDKNRHFNRLAVTGGGLKVFDCMSRT